MGRVLGLRFSIVFGSMTIAMGVGGVLGEAFGAAVGHRRVRARHRRRGPRRAAGPGGPRRLIAASRTLPSATGPGGAVHPHGDAQPAMTDDPKQPRRPTQPFDGRRARGRPVEDETRRGRRRTEPTTRPGRLRARLRRRTETGPESGQRPGLGPPARRRPGGAAAPPSAPERAARRPRSVRPDRSAVATAFSAAFVIVVRRSSSVVIFANALAFGQGGAFTRAADATPTVNVTPAPSASESPSGSPGARRARRPRSRAERDAVAVRGRADPARPPPSAAPAAGVPRGFRGGPDPAGRILGGWANEPSALGRRWWPTSSGVAGSVTSASSRSWPRCRVRRSCPVPRARSPTTIEPCRSTPARRSASRTSSPG